MTLEEIENLVIDDVRTELTSRVLANYGEQLDGHPELLDELISNEFHIYKQELIVAEESRLADIAEAERLAQEEAERLARESEEARVSSLQERIDAISDIRIAFYSLHDEPNMDIWIRENIFKNQDVDDVELKISELEAKDLELKPTQLDVDKRQWEDNLRQALIENKITTDGLVEAVARHVILGDTSRSDALRDTLTAIDTANPRPQEP